VVSLGDELEREELGDLLFGKGFGDEGLER